MIVQLIAFFISFSLAVVYLKWCHVKKYWSDRGIPYAPPSLIFGNLTFLQKENTGKWFCRMRENFSIPYLGIWIFWKPAIIINSPEIGHNILVKDFDNFRNRYISSGKTDPIGGLNIFAADDPLWTNMRRHITGIFTASKLRSLQGYVLLKAKELVQRIDNDRNTKINLRNLLIDYTTDIIGTSAFGIKSDVTLTGEGVLRSITKDFSKFSLHRAFCWISIFFLPSLVDIFRFKFFPESSIVYFKKIFRTVAQQREDSKDSNNKDLMGILLKLKKENAEVYTDEVIMAQAAILLQGGFDTTATVMTYTFYELAHNPVAQEKLYQELKEARDKIGSDNFDLEMMSDLTYLEAVIQESLRKYPQMGWLDRVAIGDYRVDDKLTIEAGTVVYVNAIGMHYNPEYFPNPHEFNPDRFLPENKDKIDPYTFMPFGDGPRFCIGKRYGMMNMRYALSQIILNYKLRSLPNTPIPNDIQIEKRGMFFIPGEPLYIDFVPRK